MLALSTISSYKDDHLPEMEGLGAPGPQTLPLVKITDFKKHKLKHKLFLLVLHVFPWQLLSRVAERDVRRYHFFQLLIIALSHRKGFIYTEYDVGPWLWLATGNSTNGTNSSHWIGLSEPGMWSFFPILYLNSLGLEKKVICKCDTLTTCIFQPPSMLVFGDISALV